MTTAAPSPTRGVTVAPYNGVTEISHSGSTGGYSAWLARYPDRQLSVALMCNAPSPPGQDAITQLTNAFLGVLPETQGKTGLPDPVAYAGRFVNTRTGFPLNLAVSSGELQLGGRALPRLSETKWKRGRDDFTFLSPDRLQVDAIDGNSWEYVRTPAVTPTPAQLAEYAGRYASDEARATYKVAVEADKLVVRIEGWPDTVGSLTPVYKDAFTWGGVLVRFRRDADGRISAASLGDGRMRDLRAARLK